MFKLCQEFKVHDATYLWMNFQGRDKNTNVHFNDKHWFSETLLHIYTVTNQIFIL